MTDAPRNWSGIRVLVVSPTPTHPQDHGNRKRIFEICRELKSQGAWVHFAHYASEHDWRHGRPMLQEQKMRAAWDGYDLIAPSRYLHMPAVGRDHLIDEWADPALAAYVTWACHVHRFDAIIVNYTWLSVCLDSAPASVFKILDTHDAFGRRRAMLEKLGAKAEFFHTTEEEEAKGLAKANLVWAIKDDERDYFMRDLGAANCLTMLHAEAARPVWQSRDAEGFLRAGVIGARNNVNRLNLENFLAAALPLFHSYLADVKIVIAGGCADDFRHLDHPNIELMGRVAEVDDFYRAVDVVVAPIQASTGLKIKVSEALAAGAPLVALAHATEGYPTEAPLHLLPDFKALAMALIELAFEREKIAALAEQSHRICAAIKAKVLQGLEQTRQQIIARDKNHVCVVAPVAALDPGSLLHDHLKAVLAFIAQTKPVALYLTGVAAKVSMALFNEHGENPPVFAEPGLIAALGERAPAAWRPIEIGDLFACRGFERAYFMADGSKGFHGSTGGLSRAYVRHDAVLLAGGDADGLVEYLRPTVPTLVMSADQASVGGWAGQYGIVDIAVVPWGRTEAFTSVAGGISAARGILLIARSGDSLVAPIEDFAARIGGAVTRVDPDDAELRSALVDAGSAALVVDLASPQPLAAILREAVKRLGIPVVTPVRGHAGAERALCAPDLYPSSLLRLLQTISLLLADGEFAAQSSELARSQTMAETGDGGWFWLWRDLAGQAGQGASWEELLHIG